MPVCKVKNPADTLKMLTDTVKNSTDSAKMFADAVKVSVDLNENEVEGLQKQAKA